jgi:hypothetical protein
MSLLVRYRKLDFTTTLRIDAPDLEELAKDLQSSAIEQISCESPEILADLAWQSAPDGNWRILLKGRPWSEASLSSTELYFQSDSLLDDFVRERLPESPLLHAGGVVDDRGSAAVICGKSGSGKTSLVLASVLRGLNWLSDEMLCFRQSDPLAVEGIKRNFNLKERSFAVFPETSHLTGVREFPVADERRRIRFINPDALPGGRFVASGEVRVFIVPEYAADTAGPALSPLSGPEFVNYVVPELRTNQVQTIEWLAQMGRKVPAYKLRYRAPGGAVDCVINLLGEL